MASDREANFSL